MLSLQKASNILGAFSAEQPEWGVRALAAHLGVPRATAHAYLAGLTEAGFLRRTPHGKYRLSWHIAEMGAQLTSALPWFQDARALLTRLALDVQAVAFLCILEGEDVVAAMRERHPDADIDLPLDVYLPATATASGKLLYVYAGMTPREFAHCTQSSITTADEWKTEVARVRRLGYAYSIEEWIPGQCTLAVPYHHGGSVVASIGVQMSAGRYLREERQIRSRVMDLVREAEELG
ncbi:IclR family transcriptional regulator [Deinococcus wulumuqiensis]|uniref:IclR family transcriptional regulator n=1 Tax=Deinococcus wulumuqiensis TaxID=980427 RepID=A0A345IG21_9DEIO|nr:IclR family transcriptional regulator [Deinococcus wulumuqiensis]AXG98643.1 IclR family transcriptional regulator [Deinococcus wulumuqiensis]QII20369.1 IclR family transcriptional regulator [Deinococcus wulumuqiensis R12]GGI82387.1 IclR family transcriptional regulator [Deinococcus wulumuqiensis]GGP29453.1 IclR family transcriptional regulator [Deinococcus wulumuqiensis]